MKEDFLGYLHEWEKEIYSLSCLACPKMKREAKTLSEQGVASRKTLQGIKITGTIMTIASTDCWGKKSIITLCNVNVHSELIHRIGTKAAEVAWSKVCAQ